jgi:hypothetical protein
MKRLILGCGTTTSTMIMCTPVLFLSEVSYVDDSFSKHYALA